MILVLLADAVGFHYTRDPNIRNKLVELFKCVVPAKSLLAYSSGIHTSIWTSNYISHHGKWLNYELRSFPGYEIKISQIAWKLKSLVTFLSKRLFSQYNRYYIPREISGLFKSVEYDFGSPFYHEKLHSLFQILDQNNVRFHFLTCKKVEEMASLKLEDDLNIVFLDEFDALGHKYGPHSSIVKRRILKLLNELEIMRNAQKNVSLIMFSDHGMQEVQQRFDVLKKLELVESSGFELGKDYMVFLDATMARFWVRSQGGQQAIFSALSDAPGHILSTREIENYNIPVNDRFGNLIFLADPGVEVFPNFFHPFFAGYVRGLHGYAPEIYSSYGIFAATHELNCKEFSLLDISPTLVKHLGLRAPREWKGIAHELR